MIKNRILTLGYRILGFIACGSIGYLIFASQSTTYTIVKEPITNLLVPFPRYFWLMTTGALCYLVVKGMLQIKKEGKEGQTTLTAHVRGGFVATSILLVLYYHLLLAPTMPNQNTLLEQILFNGIPVFWLLDGILFDVRNQTKKYDPWLWLFLQVYLYIGIILIRAQSTKSTNPFVHDVLHLKRYGLAGVAKNIIILSVIFIVISYLVHIIDGIGKPKATDKLSNKEA